MTSKDGRKPTSGDGPKRAKKPAQAKGGTLGAADAGPENPSENKGKSANAPKKPAARKRAVAHDAGAEKNAASAKKTTPDPASKPGTAREKPRKAATRDRAAGRAEKKAATRSDTRTTTRAKAKPRKAAQPAAQPAAAPPAEAVTRAAPPPAVAPFPVPEAQTGDLPVTISGTTAAFVEAAFGPGSALPEQLLQNIERIESLTQRLTKALSARRSPNPGVEGPGADFFAGAGAAWVKLLTEQPAKILDQQVGYWGETLRLFAETQSALSRGEPVPEDEDAPKDRRFANPLWDSNPFFSFVKRQYQINAKALENAVGDLDIEDMTERRRMDWFTRQMIDMMAPTNFLATNPDALEKAVRTEGESLVRGLENLVADVEENAGEIIVSLADRNAFRVGANIGTTEGSVVARAPLYELIQYKPLTDQVRAIPLVIFPPWINKFYILDLKAQNSLVKWTVEQGYTLFVVSWKNPDTSYAETGMDDYVSAMIEVMDRIQDLTGEEKVNAIGYCIAGTTLALTLALLKLRGIDRVNSATFFTTLTDFTELGEFTTYLQDDFVEGIEAEVKTRGVLPSSLMTRTFSFLRANDLVWAPAIRSYMLGEPPPAFDLLFWNGDGTNLPGRMAVEYLRGLCQENRFAQEGFSVLGQVVRLSDVTLPVCAIACETDHIAPWRDSWRGVSRMGSNDKQFILSQSGHIAGIVNPPSKKKYGHYTSAAGFAGSSQDWLDGAAFHDGTWWGRWSDWLAQRSGGFVGARPPIKGLGPAPGEYVHERPRV